MCSINKLAPNFRVFIALLLTFAVENITGTQLSIPLRCRTEGKVTLLIPQNSQIISHHLTFSESINKVEGQEAVSIGYMSYKPNTYYSIPGAPTISVGQDRICRKIDPTATFVPEIAWFIQLMFNTESIRTISGDSKPSKSLRGPTGLLDILISTAKEGFAFERNQTHRNVWCDVITAKTRSGLSGDTVKYEIFIPKAGDRLGPNADYFSVQAALFDDHWTESGNNTNSYKYKIIIDYYNIDAMDGNDERYNELQKDFNLPLASGCSTFLRKVQPSIEYQTFSMTYHQLSVLSPIFIAYNGGYLRKESIGKSVSIWDLNEDYLYHINVNTTNVLDKKSSSHLRPCSVLKIIDAKLGPGFKPFETQGLSLDVLNLLGAQSVSYMGTGVVRELPCLIYETVLDEPPVLFALSSEQRNTKASFGRNYIVQYYIVEGQRTSPYEPEFKRQTEILNGGFWPARIDLYRRNLNTLAVELLDSLEIFDFYSSLQGWNKKPSELFIASECFDDENEQLRIEVDIKFPRVHETNANPKDKSLLTKNKYKLENDLIDSIFKSFSISKMHLTDYELKLRPHHVDLNLIVADRKEAKTITYCGAGKLPEEDSYEMNRVIWQDQSEESCILTSSLLADVSLTIYCPSMDMERSRCISIYDEMAPTYESFISTNPLKPTCHVYKFQQDASPPQGTETALRSKFKFANEFNFEAKVGRTGEKFEMLQGIIEHFDISHEIQLLAVDDYMFVLNPSNTGDSMATSANDNEMHNQNNVRYFDSISYPQESDCVKMCNLDVNCKSYSYCFKDVKQRCTLSSLDIRASKVGEQLALLSLPSGGSNEILVKDNQDGYNYRLIFEDSCSIRERDYLSMFSRTDEIISLDSYLSTQYQSAASTFDCAKQSVDLELSYPDHHVAMFAYCASTGTCLLDENLFASTTNASTLAQYDEDADELGTDYNKKVDKELLCSVYRKKYQTYFMVSADVLEQNSDTQQIELPLNTVEECARACWNQLGKVCGSFDYCNPDTCLINQVSSKSQLKQQQSKSAKFELRPSCLHYERNMKLDELRRLHQIGRHEYLDLNDDSSKIIWPSLLTGFFTLVSFVYGLMLGRNVEDKMNKVRIMRQPILNSSGLRRVSQMFGHHNGSRASTTNGLDSNEDYGDDDSNAMRMNVIESADHKDDAPLQEDF